MKERIIIVDKHLGLSGKNLLFGNDDFFGLKVGEFVNQIGNGKENGTIRTDQFLYPVKYVGSIECQFEKKEKMFAFELPHKIDDANVYLLYGSTDSEIFTEAVYSMKDKITKTTTGYTRFYAPEFVRVIPMGQTTFTIDKRAMVKFRKFFLPPVTKNK
ncbi:MAG: hypothetical protein V4538_02425 [Bacteroidota bacterium]